MVDLASPGTEVKLTVAGDSKVASFLIHTLSLLVGSNLVVARKKVGHGTDTWLHRDTLYCQVDECEEYGKTCASVQVGVLT